MQYVICGGDRDTATALIKNAGVETLASGDMLVLEGPWMLGPTVLGVAADDADFSAFDGAQGVTAYSVEGLASPADGGAFVVAAHMMRDAQAFRPYAEAIPGLLERFGVRSLARGGKVIRLAGGFAPDRGVVLEFASTTAVLDFYMSEVYAPLLALRLRTTDPRFAVITRTGSISPAERRAAEDFLSGKSDVLPAP